MVYIFVARDGNLVKRVRLAPRRNFYSYQEEENGGKSSNPNELSTKTSVKNSTSVKTFVWNFRAKLLLNNKIHDQ
jgi:hypothetical protein